MEEALHGLREEGWQAGHICIFATGFCFLIAISGASSSSSAADMMRGRGGEAVLGGFDGAAVEEGWFGEGGGGREGGEVKEYKCR
jgi:hypothetical protein